MTSARWLALGVLAIVGVAAAVLSQRGTALGTRFAGPRSRAVVSTVPGLLPPLSQPAPTAGGARRAYRNPARL